MQKAAERLRALQAATESLMEVYAAALRCAELHEQAGMALPEAVARLISGGEQKPKVDPPPEKPMRLDRTLPPVQPPVGIVDPPSPDWISVPLEKAVTSTTVGAVLRPPGQPVSIQRIAERLSAAGLSVPAPNISNVGTRLNSVEIIEFTKDGWVLKKDSAVAVLRDKRLWGPPAVFQSQELAAHRREAIVAVLGEHKAVGRAELVDVLQRMPWVKAPVNPHLVKADLEKLQGEGLVRQNDDWTWSLAPEREGQQLRLARMA